MIFNNRYKVGSFLPFLKISELASSRFQKSKYHSFSHLPSFFFLKNEYLEFIQFLFGTKWAIIYGFFFEQKVWQVILADILMLLYKSYVYFFIYSVRLQISEEIKLFFGIW